MTFTRQDWELRADWRRFQMLQIGLITERYIWGEPNTPLAFAQFERFGPDKPRYSNWHHPAYGRAAKDAR